MAMARSHKTTQVHTSHFGTIFISSRKRNRSFFLRKRINFMRSSNASLMLSSFSENLSRHPFARSTRSQKKLIGLVFLCHVSAGKRSPCSDHRGHAPPENESSLQNQFWRAGCVAEPLHPMPDQRRGGNTEYPGDRGDGPDEFPGGPFFAEFFGPHAYTELGAAGEITRQIYVDCAQRGERFGELELFGGAGLTIGEMRVEPFRVVERQRLDVLLRDQFFCAFVIFFVH